MILPTDKSCESPQNKLRRNPHPNRKGKSFCVKSPAWKISSLCLYPRLWWIQLKIRWWRFVWLPYNNWSSCWMARIWAWRARQQKPSKGLQPVTIAVKFRLRLFKVWRQVTRVRDQTHRKQNLRLLLHKNMQSPLWHPPRNSRSQQRTLQLRVLPRKGSKQNQQHTRGSTSNRKSEKKQSLNLGGTTQHRSAQAYIRHRSKQTRSQLRWKRRINLLTGFQKREFSKKFPGKWVLRRRNLAEQRGWYRQWQE